MKAYMVQSAKQIEPFGDHPGECLIANRRLADLQAGTLRKLGLQLETVCDASQAGERDEHIVFDDCLYFTPELLDEFITRSRRIGTRTTCALKPGVTTLRSVTATQDVQVYPDRIEYGLCYVPERAPQGENRPVVIEPDQFFESVRFPEHMIGSTEYLIPLSDRVMIRIDHWANLWVANIFFIVADMARLKRSSKVKLLGLALKARSTDQWKVLRHLNKIGPNCDIHPTAYIEASTIGTNVKIGAGSVIRSSIVGDGSYIANNATVELSVIGQGCTIHNGCVVQFSVLYPHCCTSVRSINLSLWGRETFASDGVAVTDFRFDGRSVRVLKEGSEVDTQNTLLGTCLGHRVYLGAGCILPPGRAIPNDWRLVPERSRTITSWHSDGNIPGHRLIEAGRPSPILPMGIK